MAELDETEFGLYQRCRRCRSWLPYDGDFFAKCRNVDSIDDVCISCRQEAGEIRRAPKRSRAPKPPQDKLSDAIAALLAGPGAWRDKKRARRRRN